MAERIKVDLVDDIDGSPAKHTVTFALDGVTYEIDLNEGHERQLRTVLNRYIKAARSPKSEKSRTSKQQEREEERVREENKQLTEQIRGAAQRTRDRLKAEQVDAPSEPVRPAEPERADAPEPVVLNGGGEETEPEQVPAVSLPLFSSAVD
ncbi:histone-like nucleoid-structuring protein Lsr2 [Saccharopolyspora griseoalba]|uniref:Lsr2 family protein n=1 Tax=Saccharopolyspora griseoalba TaxID=1431848 RepID=A0ABW2LN78_9PSEU